MPPHEVLFKSVTQPDLSDDLFSVPSGYRAIVPFTQGRRRGKRDFGHTFPSGTTGMISGRWFSGRVSLSHSKIPPVNLVLLLT
jgi:hypothetical protein